MQMTRLNEGLALFDAILIVPMFQIAWTFFSICTGFIYFQEYQVLSLSLSLSILSSDHANRAPLLHNGVATKTYNQISSCA